MIEPRTPNSLAAPSWMNTLGWAAYLGMSWTWCIGMFLPVLLIRDYGIWGFVVFAVPTLRNPRLMVTVSFGSTALLGAEQLSATIA